MKRLSHKLESKIALGDLGCYAGPPIGACRDELRLRNNAIWASARLRDAILRAGLAA